ncbi:hypothetical protein NB706_003736 [Xanthomonas sacchari]|nr:hypothetical protein [Xanthomonas sacchari]
MLDSTSPVPPTSSNSAARPGPCVSARWIAAATHSNASRVATRTATA